MATPKERLRKSIEDLTEEQAIQALELLRHLIQRGHGNFPVEILPPPADAPPFAEFDPLVISGQPASELLIADRR
jgi:hypothetical protein